MLKKVLSAAAGASALAGWAAENLVRNPSFETDEAAFSWERMESPRERVKAKEDPRYVSRPDALHVKDGARAWFFRCDNALGRNNVTFTGLPVTPGKRYVFKAHYYLDDAEGPTMVWGNYHERDADGLPGRPRARRRRGASRRGEKRARELPAGHRRESRAPKRLGRDFRLHARAASGRRFSAPTRRRRPCAPTGIRPWRCPCGSG